MPEDVSRWPCLRCGKERDRLGDFCTKCLVRREEADAQQRARIRQRAEAGLPPMVPGKCKGCGGEGHLSPACLEKYKNPKLLKDRLRSFKRAATMKRRRALGFYEGGAKQNALKGRDDPFIQAAIRGEI